MTKSKTFTPKSPRNHRFPKPWIERQGRRILRKIAENERCYEIIWKFEMDHHDALWRLHQDLQAIGVESGIRFSWDDP